MKKTIITAVVALTAFASAASALTVRTPFAISTIQEFAPNADLSALTDARFSEVLSAARSADESEGNLVRALINAQNQAFLTVVEADD